MAGNKGTKVKRKKYQLYKKRKSTARKIAEAAALIIVLGGLCFVGYSVADPLINYFRNLSQNKPVVTEWTPDETTPSEQTTTAASDVTDTEATTEAEAEAQPLSFFLPDSALDSASALSAAVKSAKASGYTAVYVTLKDTDGYLRYTTTEKTVKDTDLVTGKLSLKQIYSAINGAGLTPIAVMNTTLDSMTSAFVDDTAFRFDDDSYTWLDARANEGGKRWSDPFRAGTKTYFSALSAEIAKSGFTQIVFANTLFPEFTPYDKTVLNAHFFTETRYTALSALVSSMAEAASKNKATSMLEVKLSDVTGAKLSGTAELLLDKAGLSKMKIIVVFSDADFDDDISDGDEKLNISADTEKYIKSLFSAAKTALSGYELLPCIDSTGLSAETLEKMKTALKGMGYDEIAVK